MSKKPDSQWWDKAWNPFTGCTPCSEGCEHCYAAAMARRFKGSKAFPDGFKPTFHEDKLDIPFKTRKPTTFFVCNTSDFFHESFAWMGGQAAVMDRLTCLPSPHRFLLLTKRPQNIPDAFKENIKDLPHVWIGITAENQARLDERLPILAERWPGHKFLSVEPMLGPVRLSPEQAKQVEWVICGGENGPGARECAPWWTWSLANDCDIYRVPFFFKQFGSWMERNYKGTSVLHHDTVLDRREYPWEVKP